MRGLAPGVVDCPARWATKRTPERKTLGGRAANYAVELGTPLMPWQRQVLDVALELDPETGRFVYRFVNITVPRQNGKTTLIEVLVLMRGLGMGETQKMLYAAQNHVAARKKVFDDWMPSLQESVFGRFLNFRQANGSEQLQFANGSTMDLSASTRSSSQGMTLDLAIVDEAFSYPDNRMDQNIIPTIRTRPNPQMWIVSTAGTPDASPWLLRKVEQGRQAVDDEVNRGLCYFEWSAAEDDDPADPKTWAKCTPGLGYTVNEDVIHSEFLSTDLSDFRRFSLNQWVASMVDPVIPMDVWMSLLDEHSEPLGAVSVAFDVSIDRKHGSIAIAGHRTDGKFHIEITHYQNGAEWIPKHIAKLWHEQRPVVICCDKNGPAGSLIVDLENLNVPKQVLFDMPSSETSKACGQFYDGCMTDIIRRHDGKFEESLTTALDGAVKRPMADAWVWNRKSSAVDISPLVAVTLAYYGIKQHNRTPEVYSIAEIMAQKEAAAAGQSDSKTPVTPATPEVLAPDEFEELEDDD
jgi:hypothetical protein